VLTPANGPNSLAAIPNPSAVAGDPRLLQALLPQTPGGRLSAISLPPAVVAMPIPDRGAEFIALRQGVDPVTGPPECAGWTSGLWAAVMASFNRAGVQLAVVSQLAPVAGWPAFAEAIVSGPVPVLDSLAGQVLPASCRTITGYPGYSGGVTQLPAASVGLGSRAYEVTGTGTTPVWEWAEVIRGRSFVLEMRMEATATPIADPAGTLGDISNAAYQRAVSVLGS
jgi:hypothetical protein